MMNGMQQAQPQPPDGNMQVAITFTLNTWNQVLSLIVKAPWEIADPLVREIHTQIKNKLEGQVQETQKATGALPSGERIVG